jgi:hypothetical protein
MFNENQLGGKVHVVLYLFFPNAANVISEVN